MTATEPPARRGPRAAAGNVPAPAPPRLIVAGATGRLGSVLIEEARRAGIPVAGGVARSGSTLPGPRGDSPIPVVPPSGLPGLLGKGDVYVSAWTKEAEIAALPVVAAAGRPAVVATTGLGPEGERSLARAARRIPIVREANFAVGAHLLARLARAIGPMPAGFDASLVELHRRGKRDHPSATACGVAAALAASGIRRWETARGRRTPGTLEIASLRAGETPGTHLLLLAGPHESLRLEHQTFDRAAFAAGVLAAARWLAPSTPRAPGLYGLADVLSPPRIER